MLGFPKVASFGWMAARLPSGRGSGPGATTTSVQRRMVAIPGSTVIDTRSASATPRSAGRTERRG